MIILEIQADGVVTATFDMQEHDHAEIKRLFGTPTLPLPYFLQGAASEDVTVRGRIRQHVQSLNPCSVVAWSPLVRAEVR